MKHYHVSIHCELPVRVLRGTEWWEIKLVTESKRNSAIIAKGIADGEIFVIKQGAHPQIKNSLGRLHCDENTIRCDRFPILAVTGRARVRERTYKGGLPIS